MTASERKLLTLLMNGQPRLRGLGIVDLSGSDRVVVQRPSAGVTTYLVVTSPRGGGPATLPPTVTTGLHSLGVRPLAVRAVGTLGDHFSVFLTDGGSMMLPMNSQFLELQQAIQNECRKFTTMSNASKTRQEISSNNIRNIR